MLLAACCVLQGPEDILIDEYIVQSLATACSTATEQQRRDSFTVLAAIAPVRPVPPDAQHHRVQRPGVRLLPHACAARAPASGREQRTQIFSEGSTEVGSEEPL